MLTTEAGLWGLDRLTNSVVQQQRQRLLLGGTTASDFAKFIAAETEKWAKVIRFAGIKAL